MMDALCVEQAHLTNQQYWALYQNRTLGFAFLTARFCL